MDGTVTMKRPRTCPDPDCEILYMIGGSDDHVDNGGSYFCFGKLGEPSILKFKNYTHINRYSMCICSPLKGIIRYLMNANDAFLVKLGVEKILEDNKESTSPSE